MGIHSILWYGINDDDDRAYNHSIDDPGFAVPGWYPEWNGPDFGAFEDLQAHLISTGEGSLAPDDCEWLPEFNSDDLPF